MVDLYGKKIAILGVGAYLNRRRQYLDPSLNIVCYADNDPHKWGTYPYGGAVECIAPQEMQRIGVEAVIIGVRPGESYAQLKAQSEGLGFTAYPLKMVTNQYIDTYEMMQREIAEKKVAGLFGEKRKGHRLILVNTPQVTSTIGDHAIATAEVLFLKKYFPEHEKIEIGDRFFWENRDEIKSHIYPSDVLLIQGGGYLGSLWKMWREDTVRYILQSFQSNTVIILPQTMFFEDDEDGKIQKSISQYIYNSHDNLIMCFREANSYKRSAEILKGAVARYLIPDTVLSMEYTGPAREKKGVAFCMKNDKETIWAREKQNEIISFLREQGYDVITTTMFYDEEIHSPEERECIVRKKMEELAGYCLVITDAMHCMVLAAISGTACIGIESITGKVGGIYQWLKTMPYIAYTDNPSEMAAMVENMKPYMEMQNHYDPSDFEDRFQQLADIIADSVAM